MPSTSTHLARLIALADEAEQILARSIASHDIRHACAVARGYLDLARSYNEPVNVEDVERVLERMREALRLGLAGSAAAIPGAQVPGTRRRT
jgi:hypothetical protein